MPANVRFFENAAELRAWFEANHDQADQLWLGFHHKRSKRQSYSWKEAVDQALCFGWIDSVRYPLGDHSSATRMTPRRKRSIWSNVNVKRYQELERAGLVHPAGRAAFEKRDEERSRVYSYENWPAGLDAETEAEFRRHPAAWKFFEAQPPSYRRRMAYLVTSAKRPETRARRLKLLIEFSQKGERRP
ncbi:MAG TPA: YdeI/OmpD-associated family protein [Candidatus Dormibacteraeota bacterium]|nr:YdeI/OmpD-associated family protein [Candidatus Dormibacteraeota bacterium]